MLGTGIQFLSPALSGAGGGGAFDPSQLTDPVAIYEYFDATSIFSLDQLNITAGSCEPTPQATGPWNNWTSAGNVAVVADKAGLINAGVSYGTFEDMCNEYDTIQSIPLNTTTGWTLGTGWSINTSTQKLESDGTTANSEASYNLGSYIEDNTWYRFQFRVSHGASDYIGVSIGDVSTPLSSDGNVGSTGRTDYYFNGLIYSNGVNEIKFASGTIALLGDFWDIKVQKIPGNHMYFPTEANFQRDGNSIGYLDHNINVYGHTLAECTFGTELNMLIMHKPDAAAQPNTSGGLGGVKNGSVQRAGWNNGSQAATTWERGFFIEDTSGVQWVYDPGGEDLALHITEAYLNSTSNTYEVWWDNSSVASGTLAGSLALNGSTGQATLMYTPDASIPTSQEGHHEVYAFYIYGGTRDASLYTHVNSNTGSNF